MVRKDFIKRQEFFSSTLSVSSPGPCIFLELTSIYWTYWVKWITTSSWIFFLNLNFNTGFHSYKRFLGIPFCIYYCSLTLSITFITKPTSFYDYPWSHFCHYWGKLLATNIFFCNKHFKSCWFSHLFLSPTWHWCNFCFIILLECVFSCLLSLPPPWGEKLMSHKWEITIDFKVYFCLQWFVVV